jgi:glutamate formiminotransferase
VLECVINISEGRDPALIAGLAQSVGEVLLDVHRDDDHNRSVFTLAGEDPMVEAGARRLALAAAGALDLRHHQGVHPRLGVIDVVPWIALEADPDHCLCPGDPQRAVAARDRFALWAAAELALPCFLYGPPSLLYGPPSTDAGGPTGRVLPDIRRHAWRGLRPDVGPATPDARLGATCVGARGVLVAYNLWLRTADVDLAKREAAAIRSPSVRALGLPVGDMVQVSCNLIDPWSVGPEVVFDAVSSRVDVARAELVGLLPRAVLDAVPSRRWHQLDIGPEQTIEARLLATGLDGGRFD